MFYIIFFSQICVSGHKMSLLKWQEMARSKSALGKKINFVHDAITQKKLGDETSQIGFEKMFKPITSKLDESIASNLRSRSSFQPRKKKAKKAEIDYYPEVDPFENMDVEGLFEDPVPPQSKKQISAAPPTYEEVIQEVGEDPPEYDEDEFPDYGLAEGDEAEAEVELTQEDIVEISDPILTDEDEFPDYGLAEGDEAEAEVELTQEDIVEISDPILTGLNILSYKTVDATLASSETSATQKKNFLEKSVIPDAIFRRNQLKGYKSSITKQFKKGEISKSFRNKQNDRIDRSFRVLNDNIKYYQQKSTKMGSGLRRKKGGSIRFFSNPKELLQKLEVIIGSILAGNTNQGIRNTGVEILDFLLKEGAINKSQHERIFKKYFNL